MSENVDELDSKLLLGRYRVVRLLGEGGMGTVHLARVEGAEGFTRPVVVKRMRTDIRSSEEGNRLFKREAEILSKMQHPGITNIIDFGIDEGAHIMVLEYVHGYSLSPWLDYRAAKNLPIAVDICIYIVRRILDALHYAHQFETAEGQEIQIVHRDVAPDNVLLSKKGHVHLLDFGIASMSGPSRGQSTKSGVFRGKMGYAAPETIEGEAATPRSDQYSAAVLLLELLVQETPFFSDSIGETVVRMVNEVPDPPSKSRADIPPGLDEVLAQALEKKPPARFESALAFSRRLRKLQTEDDEEVALRLKEVVRDDFALLPETLQVEPLRVREEALSRIFPKGLNPGRDSVVALHDLENTGRIAAELAPTASGVLPPRAEGTEKVSTNQKQLHGLLLGLLIVGGVIAIGLGAAVALLKKSGSGGEQVVVVGGPEPSPVTPFPTLGQGAPDAPTLDAPTLTPKKTGGPKAPLTPHSPKTLTRQQKLSSAVQGKSAAYEDCFIRHLHDPKKSPEVYLHFSVAAKGGSAQVSIEPATWANAPLGICLKGAAGQVQFPVLAEGVSFRVPVRARFARFKK